MRTVGLASILALLSIQAPASASDPGDVPPEAVVATLPFLDVDEPNRIYLDLAAEGQRALPLLLDTGATHAVMSPRAARAAGVMVRAIKNTPYRRKTRLGRDLHFWVDTRSSDTAARTFEYAVLGGDFLKHFVVEIDCAARAVRWLDPDRYSVRAVQAGPGQAVLALRDSPRPIIEIAIDGKPLPVLIDTGAPWPMILSGTAARKLGIDFESLPLVGKAETVLGVTSLRLLPAADVEIGGLRLADVPILIEPKGSYGLGGETDDSMIGFDLVSRFRVRIDYRGRRMLLERQSDESVFYGVDAALAHRTGAYLVPEKSGASVFAVLPDTPAARRGLRPGDFLERAQPSTTPESMLRDIADDRFVRVIRVENGERRDVELAPAAANAP